MTLSLPQLLLGAVFLIFLWVFIDWFFGEWRERRAQKKSLKKLRECHLCGKSYLENPRVKLSQCPDCAGLNTRKGHRRLA